MEIYERVMVYLHRNGITQKWISETTGIKQTRLSNIMTGRSRMTLVEFMQICEALNVPATAFLDGTAWQ